MSAMWNLAITMHGWYKTDRHYGSDIFILHIDYCCRQQGHSKYANQVVCVAQPDTLSGSSLYGNGNQRDH